MAGKDPFVIVDYDGTTLDYVRKVLYAVLRTVVHTVNHYVVLPHVFWAVALRPLLYVKPALYWRLEGFSFPHLLMLVASWAWNAGYTGAFQFHTNIQLVLFDTSLSRGSVFEVSSISFLQYFSVGNWDRCDASSSGCRHCDREPPVDRRRANYDVCPVRQGRLLEAHHVDPGYDTQVSGFWLGLLGTWRLLSGTGDRNYVVPGCF